MAAACSTRPLRVTARTARPRYGPALKASVGGLRDCVGWDCGRGLRKPGFLGALFCGEVLIYDAHLVFPANA